MCGYAATIATVEAVKPWQVDSTAAMKCNGYRLESLMAGHLDNGMSDLWQWLSNFLSHDPLFKTKIFGFLEILHVLQSTWKKVQ